MIIDIIGLFTYHYFKIVPHFNGAHTRTEPPQGIHRKDCNSPVLRAESKYTPLALFQINYHVIILFRLIDVNGF